MKYLILFIITAFVFGCNPKEKSYSKAMTVEEITKELGFNPFSFDTSSEISTSRAKGKPPKAVVIVWFNDLSLTQDGNVYTTTMPVNPKWAGVQNLTTFQSLCNWYLPMGSQNCTSNSTGQIRSWATDTDDNVHVSNIISN